MGGGGKRLKGTMAPLGRLALLLCGEDALEILPSYFCWLETAE